MLINSDLEGSTRAQGDPPEVYINTYIYVTHIHEYIYTYIYIYIGNDHLKGSTRLKVTEQKCIYIYIHTGDTHT